MKTLIFALIFSSMAMAIAPASDPEILSESEINNKVISAARDIENGRLLEGVPDFQTCKQRFQYKKGEDTAALRQRSAQEATQCFTTALRSKNSAAEIGQIADKLNLETYKLIPSKSIQEITKYLSNKMYKSLTGIEYEEDDVRKRIESLKFNKTKKIVDQKQFISLFKNQVAKNILTEVTRYCLEDLRLKGASSNASFEAHWGQYLIDNNFDAAITQVQGQPSPPGVEDNGTPFGTPSQTREDKDTAYRNILQSTFPGTMPPTNTLSSFFFFCGKQINRLCKEFEDQQTTPGAAPASTVGSRSCLTKSRLVSFKKAMTASDLIIADFNANGGGNAYQLLDDKNMVIKMYGSGQDRTEKSANELTNNASIDFFTATENEDTQKAQNCIDNGAANCEDFVIVDDSREKIQYNVEIEYSAKREAEKKRVKALQDAGDRAPLLEYLKNNGYLAAAKDIEDGKTVDLELVVSQAWDAKRIALQEEIQRRLGTRQMTESEAAPIVNGESAKVTNAKQNARETLNERARLARVIFFNNIISSNLNLVSGSNNNRRLLGQNTQALRAEIAGLNGQVNASIFQNLQDTLPPETQTGGSGPQGATGREDISNVSFLDQFLGGPEQQAQPQGGAAGGAQTGPRPAGQ